MRSLRRGWIGAVLLGLFLLGAKAVNTNAYIWKPIQVPVPMEPGQSARGTFVAELDETYEVALEFDAVLPEKRLRKLLSSVGDRQVVDISWKVSSDGRTVGAGGSGVLVYTSTGGRTFLGQIRRMVLSNPFHRGQGSFVQVIGRVRCEAGKSYTVEVDYHALDTALRATTPRLVLQLTREFWARHTKGMLDLAYAGLVLIGLSILLFFVWVGAVWAARRTQGTGQA